MPVWNIKANIYFQEKEFEIQDKEIDLGDMFTV